MNDIIRLRIDDVLIILTKKTLYKYPDCIFTKMIDTDIYVDFIHKNDNIFYLDMNPLSVKVIITFLRGYNIGIIDPKLFNDILFDAKRLNLLKLVDLLNLLIPSTNIQLNPIEKLALSITEELDKINNNDLVLHNIEKFSNIFIKSKENVETLETLEPLDSVISNKNIKFKPLKIYNSISDIHKKILRPKKIYISESIEKIDY